MQKANSRIVECPFCGTEKELLSLISGNGVGATRWSDGKTVGPMMPRVSPVQKCPRCGKYFLHYKQKGRTGNTTSDELGNLSYSQWMEAHEQFREDSNIDDRDRCIILMNMIHAYNNAYYRCYDSYGIFIHEPSYEPNPPQEEFEFFVKVIEKYIALADWSRPDDMLFKAELYREAGMFEQCKMALETIDYWLGLDKCTRDVYDGIKKRMEDKVKKVFRIGEEYVTRAEKLEAEKFQRQAEDPRWKVCKHGHCFKNTERVCRWCGAEDFVERLDEKTPVYTKKLYVGVKDDQWVLTDNPHITGQTDWVRSITIDYNGKYKFYYHMDGKNPHPLHFSTIQLEDGMTIKGGELVKMCDRVMDGNINEIKLTAENLAD